MYLFIYFCVGWKTICDATHEATCYVTLGQPAYVQLVATNTTYQMSLLKGNDRVFVFRRSKVTFQDSFNSTILKRWFFDSTNGTLLINPADKRDLGTYRVEIYDENTGTQTSNHNIQLTIKASPPTLSALCFNGERRVTCVSEEHNPQYSWSLAEGSTGVDLKLSTDNSTLSVRGDLGMTVACTVKTHSGMTSTSQTISPCPGISPVFISVWLAEIITLIALLVGGCYLYTTNSTPVMPGQKSRFLVLLLRT
ncbi:hypothetical protein ACEWY4_026985 [Coilia grayii]|uniref:Ig-like domain-containing protein n=1 Tax=Coilia grayii TaxID=363190 RepID=A0ABD1IU72_9TELE